MPIFGDIQRAGQGLFNRINQASQTPAFGLGLGFLANSPQAGFANAFAATQAKAERERFAEAQKAAQARARQEASDSEFNKQIALQKLALDAFKARKPDAPPEIIEEARFLHPGDEAAQRDYVLQRQTADEREFNRKLELEAEKIRLSEEKLDLEREELTQKGKGGGAKLTEGERKFATFARLAANAQETINSLENDKKFNPTLIQRGRLNLNRNKKGQSYEASKRAFIDAIIRPMTGAAVTQFEFDSAEKRYFPQFGDDPATIKFKQNLRQEAIDAIAAGSGRAFEQINATPTAGQTTAPEITINANGEIIQ